MSLQFKVEEFIRPLVSEVYNSSDEDMEVDVLSVPDDPQQDAGCDSDIELYRAIEKSLCFHRN